jgi:choline kinase
MKAVILAAGVGTRLGPETADKPKAMVEVNGKPLIRYQVEALRAQGFAPGDIHVLGGYRMDRIEAHLADVPVRYIYNELYDKLNNIYSFLLTKPIGDGFVLFNSDTFFDVRILERILRDERRTSLVIDDHKVLTDESMKVIFRDGRMADIHKTLPIEESLGEYIGIAKLDSRDLGTLYDAAETLIAQGRTNAWYENAFGHAAGQVEFVSVSTGGLPWTEIDDLNDLRIAHEIAPRVQVA